MKLVFVSVMRDGAMYSRCLTDNPFCAGGEFVSYDNSRDNVSIPSRYNSFLDSMPDDLDAWIVFCHEDWQPRQDMSKLAQTLDKNVIYGPIGVRTVCGIFSDRVMIKGQVRQCAKDGSAVREIRGVVRSGRVDTLDCQCLMVHSGLVRSAGLRFDRDLQFDMYAEEFCVDAFLKAGIVTRAVRMQCTHYSEGNISQGFLDALEHARAKYSECPRRFSTIVGYKTCFGGGGARPVHRLRIKIPFF